MGWSSRFGFIALCLFITDSMKQTSALTCDSTKPTFEKRQWSGIQAKIWGDGECKNLRNYGSRGLWDCKKKCLATHWGVPELTGARCTAINYSKATKLCSLRECTQPVPAPQGQYGDYRGYYITNKIDFPEEDKMRKMAYKSCIKNPECEGCKSIIKNILPKLIQESIIKEGEIGENYGSFKEKPNPRYYPNYQKNWATTLKLREGITTNEVEYVTINGTVNGNVGKRWYGNMRVRPTGLYAKPGQMVTITLPEKIKEKVEVYIGHFEFKIDFKPTKKSVIKVGSPWGGLIDLHLTDRNAIKGEFTIKVENAIKAPTFILGKTTNKQWDQTIKHYSPKWAVLRIPGQLDIYVQSLKLKDIPDMESQMSKIKKSMDVLEHMLNLPEGSQPGAERMIFNPGMGGGRHYGICRPGTAVLGDVIYPVEEKDKETSKYYDDFFKGVGNNGLVGHELGHGFCYGNFPDMGDQWTAESVASYQRMRMGNGGYWFLNSPDLDFYLLDRMVSFDMHSKGQACGDAKFANSKQLQEDAYHNCWKWLNWIPPRLHGWKVWDKVNALESKSTATYESKQDRMVDLYCEAAKHNLLPLFDLYNVPYSGKTENNCKKQKESTEVKKWLDIIQCVKESIKGTKNIIDCSKMPNFFPHEGLCVLNGVCRKDDANGGETTHMKNRFDLKGTYVGLKDPYHDKKVPVINQASCLKRAFVFHYDCKNDFSQSVTAQWITTDEKSDIKILASRSWPPEGRPMESVCWKLERKQQEYEISLLGSKKCSTGDGCFLQGKCKNNKGEIDYGQKRLDWWGCSKRYRESTCTHKDLCLARARVRYNMCQNKEDPFMAIFIENGVNINTTYIYDSANPCPDGHTPFGSDSGIHCYFPSFKDGKEAVEKKKWLDARDYCRKLSKKYPEYTYDLVSLQNEEEYNFILNNEWSEKYKKWKVHFRIWVGLNDRDEEGKWTWSDGSPLEYANPNPTAQTPPWKKGEPGQPMLKDFVDEDCVRTYGLLGLMDSKCEQKINFICEGQKDSEGQ